jgi:hypothetical protein
MGSTITKITVLTFTLLMLATFSATADCVPVNIEPGDDTAITAKKIDYAFAVITDSDYLAHNEPCIRGAILYLGGKHVEKAIPLLTKLLSYREKPNAYSRYPIYQQYAAIDALYMIGKPAVPALIRTVRENDSDTVESRNAVFALMSIYSGKPATGVQALIKAGDEQSDPMLAEKLHKAAKDARAVWCKAASCD